MVLLRNYVFDWFVRLIIIKVFCFLFHGNSAHSGFIGSARHSFLAVTRRQKRVNVKTVSKIRSKVTELSLPEVAFSVWYLRCSTFWQYFFFLNLALNLSPFCLFLCSFTTLLPNFGVKVLLFLKHSSPESSMNKSRFRTLCKRLLIYLLFICCVKEKQFCRRSYLAVLLLL